MFLPKPSESGSFELTPAGTFTAICYRFLDRGTQSSDFNGERKIRREVMLTWELCGELMEDGKPFSASKTYTWSMHEKATLRKDLESWRGVAFTDSDFDGPNAFNTKKLLGAPCTLSIIHVAKGDKTYANIGSIGKVMKGVQVPPLVNPKTYLALVKGEFDATIFAALSDKMKGIIASSPEYHELSAQAERHDDPGSGPREFAPLDDDIPF
jgi:hypothetical protein